MANKLLLIKDVEDLGRSGDIVTVKPGFARNYLLPRGMAIVADKPSLRMQARLKAEREMQAALDKKEAETVASNIEGISLTKIVKVDHEGHMYGSVSAHDIVDLLLTNYNIVLEKSAVGLKHPIKTTGVHHVTIKLKEGVTASINVKVISDQEVVVPEATV